MADFGLTGYGKKSTDDNFHHAEDKTTQNKIMAAFKKLRPNSDQRLHITTLTDPLDIRKWTKAHYDETSFKAPDTLKKLSQITELLGKIKLSKGARLKDETAAGLSPSNSTTDETSEHSIDHTMSEEELEAKQKAVWEEYVKQRQEEHPLPKADPKDIVLSRANFLLEYGEERLPPYHVFYSNSECIAVWVKTGRWSTLQTAVFLSSNAIGGAKSATLATLGVAAAHAILAPVVAVGGLIWVSAPMVILKKSREQWEQNTMKMTDLYWNWAPASVFVCAIEHWSELGYERAERLEQQRQQQIEQQEGEGDDPGKRTSNGTDSKEAAEKDKQDIKQEGEVPRKDDNEQPTSPSANEEEALEDVGL